MAVHNKAVARGAIGRAGKAPRIASGGKAPRFQTAGKMPAVMQGMKANAGKKKRRFKPGTQAMREIRRLQSTVKLLIPRASFSRLVREIAQQYSPEAWGGARLTPDALNALQEAAESFLVNHFESTLQMTAHADRITAMAKDSKLVCAALKGQGHPIYKEMDVRSGRLSYEEAAAFRRKEHERQEKIKAIRKKAREEAAAAKEEAKEAKQAAKAAKALVKQRKQAEKAAAVEAAAEAAAEEEDDADVDNVDVEDD